MPPAKDKTCPDLGAFKEILRQKGLKATPQRIIVHEAMMALGHASADMVVDFIDSKGLGKTTIASVYNTLTLLSEMGVYSKRMSENNKMYFDVNTFKHLHLYDEVNNVHKDIIDDELIALVEEHFKGRRFRGYRLNSIDIQLLCTPTSNTRSGKSKKQQSME